jgi:hypothetical protein
MMKKLQTNLVLSYTLLLVMLFFSIVLSGCSKIAIYSDKELTKNNRTGIKFYTPKPYVLVKRTGNKTTPVDIELIYLPDLKNPLYAKATSGLGASKLSMTFSNGILTTFGQENDPKISELISSIAGVPGLLANATKARREADKIGAETGLLVNQSNDLVALGVKLEGVSNDIKKLLVDSNFPGLGTNQKITMQRVDTKISGISNEMKTPGSVDVEFLEQIKQVLKNMESVKQPSEDIAEDEKKTWTKVNQIRSEIQEVINKLTPKPKPQPTLTLYEIRIDYKGTHLIEVPFSTTKVIIQNSDD